MEGTLGIFGICLLFAGVHMTSGTTVNIPDPEYKIARGDNVIIPCTFTPGNTIVSISWTAEPDVQGQSEIKVVDYFITGNKMTVFKKYKGRASVVVDMAKGTANLQLQSVTSADTRAYECKVQDPDDEEGNLSDTAKLIVLVAPSTPVCSVVGKAEYFENIELTCRSEEGTPTPTYKWQIYSVSNVPKPLPPKATDLNGVLSLVNISMDTSGYYTCTSTNEIRSAKCNLTLAVMPPSMNLASTAGIIGAVVCVAVLLGIIVLICCCCRRRRKQAEEYAMGTPEEFTDKDPEGRADERAEHVNQEEERRVKSADKRDPPDDRSEKSYDRRSDYDDRREQYNDRRDDRGDRRERYDRDDRRDRYDDRRDQYDDRHDRYDDRRDRYDDRRDRYDDRRDRYDDRYDSDRYSDRYDSRDRPPSVPPNKPREPRN
ncbi:glycoprotein A33 (transmembrane), paralog a [Puntigrus tetrazona]|uniref:glycoprotein A33 (transmembrane), paralog a n=1 Tax=Puntigrus tetrazona TaxID=1606681 RepID=UPI001C8A4815|nr:glycoprotein A33 (transmembrane), paralog a [Puntigrus tetrazona]